MDDIKTQKQIVLGVMKNDQGKVLIISRVHPEKAFNGQVLSWAFPGGNVRVGETDEQALAGEMKEETGYEVKVGDKMSERDYPEPYVHLKYFKCEPVKVKTTIIEKTHQIDRVKWVEPGLLKKFFTTDIDPKVVSYLGI
ncbi:MAG: NUDIX domain-containing protein [Thermodesulfovibrionales bacterium]